MVEFRPRQSGFQSVFKPAWDYNYEAIESRIIIPTLTLLRDHSGVLTRSALNLSHNNISHTERLELIQDDGGMVSITVLGENFIRGEVPFEAILRDFFYNYRNEEVENELYPYKALMYCLDNSPKIRKIDFMFALYHLTDTTTSTLDHAITVIRELQEDYPESYLEERTLTQSEKQGLLNDLNQKYNTSFLYNDLWTSRTTVANRFNYFANHLSIYRAVERSGQSIRAFRFSDLF